MVTKKRKAPAVRTRTVYRAKKTARRPKAGYDKIGPAMATVALVGINAKNVLDVAAQATQQGYNPRTVYLRMRNDNGTKAALKKVIGGEALVKDAVAVVGGYVGGEIIRKYAPLAIKKPLAKIAKKVPKVI